MAGQEAQAEFSRVIEVDRIGPAGLRLRFDAAPDERRRLADRVGIVAVEALAAEVLLLRNAAGTVHLNVNWHADVVQSCVVTLDPVASRLEDRFELRYAPDVAGPGEGQREVQIEPEDVDPPEPLQGGRIDVGEAIAEHLALALDPYPRRPDAEVPREYGEDAGERNSPFQALRRLKDGV